ncbi:MAG: adenine phosphoribosyltransferase [bacterium]
MNLSEKIRAIPNFPKEGIIFRDITTLLVDSQAFAAAVHTMYEPFQKEKIDLVVATEARGFIFGAPIAVKAGCGFVPVRKPGKLPASVEAVEYALEYGTDKVEIHADAIQAGQRVLIVDDLLATGGTISATAKLVEKLGGKIVGISFLIELSELKGRERLKPHHVNAVIVY